MDIFGNTFDITKAKPKASGIMTQSIGIDGRCKTFISAYNRVTGGTASGQPVTIDYDQTYGCKVIANATTGTDVLVYTAVAKNHMPVPYGALAWWQIGGKTKGLVDGTSADVIAGDALEVINGGTSFIKAASSRDGASGAIAGAAQAANAAVLVDVTLIPERHSIEAT